ncbi:MAG: hypothetical protein Q9224_002201, partial [Gallowayella concinna]
MATGKPPTPTTRQAFDQPAPVSAQNTVTPASKRDLASWWKNFKKNTKKEEEKTESAEPPSGIFGVALQDSIRYANVAISLTNEHGESYIYGYVPIVVAKCGVFLKEKATDVEGIFRLSGSNKRIKELQTVFDSPDRYGKGLDWTGYTVHDAANILRRYLNNLPQPIVPLEFYERFRDPLRSHQSQAVGTELSESTVQDTGDFDHAAAIATYQKLITELPALNRQLLLYILDLLAVFASKSDLNRMNSGNLSAIFQPGLLSHPNHDMEPTEYRLSQDVLIFLIENQDSFLVGMSGTAADEKTVKDVQSGVQTRQPSSPMTPKSGMGRSNSNASGGTDSLRKFGGIRRNVSVSSNGSKHSANLPSPAGSTPGSPHAIGSGVHRSNTVPSKKSPGIPSRFSRPLDFNSSVESTPTPNNYLAAGAVIASARSLSPGSHPGLGAEAPSPSSNSSITPTAEKSTALGIENNTDIKGKSREVLPIPEIEPEAKPEAKPEALTLQPPAPVFSRPESSTPTRERKLSGLFTKSPSSEGERRDGRPPNKLKKKRPEDTNPSAQSSTHSLHGLPDSPAGQSFYTPLPTPGATGQQQTDPMATAMAPAPPLLSNTSATPTSEASPNNGAIPNTNHLATQVQSPPLKPTTSPAPSLRSRTSATDVTSQSEAEHGDDVIPREKKKEKKHRWRFSSSSKKNGEYPILAASTSEISSNAIAEQSTTSVISSGKAKQRPLAESQEQSAGDVGQSRVHASSPETTPSKERETLSPKESSPEPTEKRGPIGWIKGKVAKAKEERKEREAEKERAKSPARNAGEGQCGSKQSLSAIANEGMTGRGRSMDMKREAQDSYQKSLDKEAQSDIEAFNRLLDQVDPPSLHAALHDYSPKKFKHGMFKEDRTAVEAIHQEQPSLASSIVAKAKRQDIPTNGTIPVTPTTSAAAADVPISTPAAESPTNNVDQPSPTVQPSPTDAGPSPSASAVATPDAIGPVQGSVIESSPDTPTTTVGGSPDLPPATTTSTSTSPNAPVGGSSSDGSSIDTSSSTAGNSPGDSPSGSTDGTFPTTSAGGSSSTSAGGSSSPSGTNSFTGGSTPSLTAGQLVTTTNAEGVTIVSTIGGGYVTLSRSSSGGSSSPTITSGATRTTRRPSSTSVVLQTTTLPDGSQSTVTAVTVVPGESAAATPSGEAGAEGGSGTQGGNAALQS